MPLCILRPFSPPASCRGMQMHMLLQALSFPASPFLCSGAHKNPQLLTLLFLWRRFYSLGLALKISPGEVCSSSLSAFHHVGIENICPYFIQRITCFESSKAFEIHTHTSRGAACSLASPGRWRSLSHSVDNQGWHGCKQRLAHGWSSQCWCGHGSADGKSFWAELME